MFLSKVTSVGACVGSVAFAYSYSHSVNAENAPCHDCSRLGKRLPKARELPIYDQKDDDYVVVYDKQSELPLIKEISSFRHQLSGIASYLNVFNKQAIHIYETGLAHSSSTYEYITNEENPIPRIVTITSAGLVGILLARKGGYIKKVIYGSVGSGLAYSAFYPSTAKEYLSSGFDYTKNHASQALEKYGGYDSKKISEDASAKLDYIKGVMKFDGVTEKMKEWFEKNKENASKKINEAAATLKSKDDSTKTSN